MKRSAAAALVLLLSACGGGGGGSTGGGLLPSSPPSSPSPSPSPSPSQGPTLIDDWTTYAHDVQRTGFEQKNTGITAASVSNLQLAWRNNPDPNCERQAASAHVVADEASPIVAGGYVYYADVCGFVAALNRVDGSIAWFYQFPVTSLGGTYGTPMLDTANNVLIVSMWGTFGNCANVPGCSGHASGAYLAALDAKSGKFLWQSNPLSAGNMRGEPLVLNGIVYQGISGGDTDSGAVNGGIMAVNEFTGQPVAGLPTFYVTSTPWEGGGSWSPISYDGRYIYFGTGNTRDDSGAQDSVVQLDPTNMQSVQSYSTYGNDADEDVGGGVMIWQNTLYFSGKSGKYYAYQLNNPWIPLFSTLINEYQLKGQPSPEGNGGISTPTTDGNVIAVSNGYNASTSTGTASADYQSDLDVFPVGSDPTPCQVKATNSSIFSYAAFVGGMGFIGLDNQLATGTPPNPTNGPAPWFVAFDEHCNIIWQANPTQVMAFFYGGAAVVQSGVYAIDNAGNVYSWKLPQTIGVMSAARRAALIRPAQRVYLTSTRYMRTHRATL